MLTEKARFFILSTSLDLDFEQTSPLNEAFRLNRLVKGIERISNSTPKASASHTAKMNAFIQTDEQLNLIKCLECRLLAPPPLFDMPPPPPLSPELIDILSQDSSSERPRRQLSKMSPSQQRRCLKFKNILISRNIISHSPPTNEGIKSNVNKLAGAASATPLINLTTNQSMLLFLACFLVFLVVLTVAFVLLAKLFRIRKQLKTSRMTIEHKSHLPKLGCLSSSISSSSSSSTASTTSSANSDQSKSSTINSQLILTPSSSLLNAEKPPHLFANLFYPQVDQSGNVMSTFVGHADQYDMTTNSAAISNNYLFYNQLFSSTKQQQQQQQCKLSKQSSSVQSYKSNDDQQLYLQAVTHPNNMLNIIVADAEIGSRDNQAPCKSLDEYAEINSQLYLYGTAPSVQNIYNQFDDDASSSRLKSSSATSSCSTASTVCSSHHARNMVHPLSIESYSSAAEAPFILNLNGNKFILLNNQPRAIVAQQHVPTN